MSIFKKILRESKSIGVDTPSEGVELYDKGLQTETSSPDVNVSNVPTQNFAAPREQQTYGFVDKSAFGAPPQEPQPYMGYTEGQAFMKEYEQRTNVLDFMELPQEAGEIAKTAAYNSSISVRDYSVAGEFLRSFAAGTGQVLIGFADTIDWLNSTSTNLTSYAYKKGLESAGYEGDVADYASKQLGDVAPTPLGAASLDFGPLLGVDMDLSFTGALRSLGEEMESWDDKIDMSGLEEGSYKQLLNPKFYYTKLVKQIPNLLTFLIPASGGAKVARGLANSTKFGKATVFSSDKLTKNIKYFGNKGGGNASRLVIKGEDVAQFFGGAIGGNFAEGAMLAGQSYRDALKGGATKDQAAMAGWNVMKDNAKWIIVDGLQYSILTKGVGAIGSKLKLKSGVNFKNAASDLLIGSGVVVSDGKLEELQEVYQDWRVNKRVAEATGEDYDVGYWEYYNSPEVADTRVISFAMGSIGGGAGVVYNAFKDGINIAAERNFALDEKIESTLLTDDTGSSMVFAKAAEIVRQKGFQSGIDSKAESEIHKHEQYKQDLIANIIGNGEKDLGKANIEKEVAAGRITEKEGKHLIETMDSMADSFSQMGFAPKSLSPLSPRGRQQLVKLSHVMRHSREELADSNDFYESQIQGWESKREQPEYKNRKDFIDAQIESIKQEQLQTNQAYQQDIEGITGAMQEVFTLEQQNVINQKEALSAKQAGMRETMAREKEVTTPTAVEQAPATETKAKGTRESFTKASEVFMKETNDKKTLDSVKRINKKESAPLTNKKSRLNNKQLKDALKFWTNTGNAIAPLLRHVASKQIAGETLTNQEIAVLSENTKTIEPLLQEHKKREGAKKRITEIDQEIKKIKEGKQPLGKIVPTKAPLKMEGRINKREIYKGKQKGDDVTVMISYDEKGNVIDSQVIERNGKDDRLLIEVNKGKNESMSDALNRSLDSASNLKENFTLSESITDVNRLYSKRAIEKYGFVREGDTGTDTIKTLEKEKAELQNTSLKLGSVGKVEKAMSGKPAERNIAQEKVIIKMLRKKGINPVVADYMFRTDDSKKYYGMAQGLSIYLNSNTATQETIFHELNHIYVNEMWYETNKDGTYKVDSKGNRVVNPIIKEAIELVVNQPLFKKKMSNPSYTNQLLLQDSNGVVKTLNDLIKFDGILSFTAWAKQTDSADKSINGYLEYLKPEAKKLGFTLLPDVEQRIILEEVIVDLMSKTEAQETNGDILKKDDKKRDNIAKRFYSKIKSRFTKKESKTILENTGNAELTKLDNVIDTLIKDSRKERPAYNIRRDRLGSDKMFHVEDLNSTMLTNQISSDILGYLETLKQESKLDNKLQGPLYRTKDGMLTVAGKKSVSTFISENRQEVNSFIKELYPEGSNELNHYNNNRNDILNTAFKVLAFSNAQKSIGSTEQELEEDEYNLFDFDNRNGVNEKIGKDISSYIKLGESVQGIPVTHGQIKSSLYNKIFKYRNNPKSFEQEINDNIRALTLSPKLLSREEELLARYFVYMNEVYASEGMSLASPILDYHHEFSSYKQINFHNINVFKNKKGEVITNIKQTFGVDASTIKTDIEKRFRQSITVDKPKDSKTLSSQEISKIKFLSSIITLSDSLKEAKNPSESKKAVIKFLTDNYLSEYKDDINVDLISKDFVDKFVTKDKETNKTLVDQLIEDHGMIETYKLNGKKAGWQAGFSAERFNKESVKAWRAWESSEKTQQALQDELISKEDIISIGKLIRRSGVIKEGNINTQARVFLNADGTIQLHQGGGLKFSNRYKAQNIITQYLSSEIALGDFSSQILTPEGNKKNFISKRHQADVLVEEQLPSMSDEEIKDMFGDNVYTNNYILNREEKINVAQINGSVVLGKGIDSGNETANEKTILEVSLIAQAIVNGNETYSQSVSIVADKDINLHVTNTKLLTLEEARAIKDKLNQDGVKFTNGDAYFNFTDADIQRDVKGLQRIIKGSKDTSLKSLAKNTKALEQIVLNNAINKYYAKDLLIGKAEYFKNNDDYIKRAAGSVAMNVNHGRRFEPLMLKDETLTIKDKDGKSRKINRTDAPSFILPEDSQIVGASYGGRRNVGNHHKFVYYGQNVDNKTFEGVVGKRYPFYLKTNTFVLSNSFLELNPNLKPIAEALKLRKKEGVIPMAAFSSAMKVQSNKFKNQLIDMNKLVELNKDGGFALNEHQDRLFKYKDLNGLDGKYLGVQTELDRKHTTSIVSKQLILNLLSNPETQSEGLAVLESLEIFSKKELSKFSKFMSGNGEVSVEAVNELREELIKETDVDIYGESAMALLKDGSYDSGSVEILRSKIISIVKKRLLRIRTPQGSGTVGYQTTDFGYGTEIETGDISESAGLQSYFDKEGKPRLDENGNLEPAEVALDASLGFKEGDKIILTRIPNSKMGDNIPAVVTSVFRGTGSVVQIPSDLSDIIGSDMDGDSLHIMGRSKQAKQYNDSFDKMFNFLTLSANIEHMQEAVDFESFADGAERALVKAGLKPIEATINDLSFLGDNLKYRSNIMGRGNIGTSASINTFHKILSTHNVQVPDLKVNVGKNALQSSYKDNNNAWISLARILNIFLDEANKGRGARLNMNSVTVGPLTELVMRGISFNDAVVLINSPFMKRAVSAFQNNGTTLNEFIKNEVNGEVKELSEVSDIDISKVADGSQDVAIRNLFYNFNKYNSPSWTLRKLINLESFIPETHTEQKQLLKDIVSLMKNRNINVAGLVTSIKTPKELNELIDKGQYTTFVNSLNIKNPILRRNVNALAASSKMLEVMDPANSQGYNNIVEKYKKENIKQVESLVRSWRLAQDGSYQINLDAMPRVLQDSQDFIDSYGSMSSIKTILKQDLEQIEVAKHPFINKYFKIQETKESNFITRKDKKGSSTPVEVSKQDGEYVFTPTNLVKKKSTSKNLVPTSALRNANAKQVAKDFDALPRYVQDYLLLWDLVMNNHSGPNAILPYLGSRTNKISKKSQSHVKKQRPKFLSEAYRKQVEDYVNFNIRQEAEPLSVENNGTVTSENGVLTVQKGLSNIPSGSVKSIELSNGVTAIYKVSQIEGGSTVLYPIEASFTHDSLLPSESSLLEHNTDIEYINSAEEVQVEDDVNVEGLKEEGYEYSHVDLDTGNKIYVKKEGDIYKAKEVINGDKIVDYNGKFASKYMYMSKDMSDYLDFQREMTFQQYVNKGKTKLVDASLLGEKERKFLLEQHEKYKQDLRTANELSAKYLSPNEFGVLEIESDKYTALQLEQIIKNELRPLDTEARAKVYQAFLKVLGAKIGLEAVNDNLSKAKKNRLGEKLISELEAAKAKYRNPDSLREDVGRGDMYLNPDITSPERAEVGAVLNRLSESEISYQQDMAKLNKKMDTAFQALLKKKLSKVQRLLYRFGPAVIKYYYNRKLFENITFVQEELTPDNEYVKRHLRLKNDKEIAAIKDKLTQEELAYREMFMEMTGMVKNHLNQKIGEDGNIVLPKEQDKGKTYVPHLTASITEMALARNLVASYIMHNYSHKLKDVYVLEEGKTEARPLGEIINEYMARQANKRTSKSDIAVRRELRKLIKQANQYVEKGTDAIGNPIVTADDTSNITQPEVIDRYLSQRSFNSGFGATIDLHRSLTTYVNKMVFNYGLDSQEGFKHQGIIEQIPAIDAAISYASFKNNPNAQKWIKELLLEKYARKTGRKSLFGKDGKRHWSDDVFEALHKWTMFVGLGLNFTAAVGNIAIGKYNTFRQQGLKDKKNGVGWIVGERRYFGFGIKGFNKTNADKTRAITKYFGLITDAQAQVSEDLFASGFGEMVFAFMTGSEKYIQRTQFVGMIKENQWNSFEVVDGEVRVIPGKEAEFRALENQADEMKQKVYEVQGKGYTALDQRLIQHYSILHGILQFKRWLPTFVMDRLASEKITRSGRGYIGAYRASFDFFLDVMYNKRKFGARDFKEEYSKLPKHRQEAILRFARGAGGSMLVLCMIAALKPFGEGDDETGVGKYLNKLFWDMNLLVNVDKWRYMASMPALQTGENMVFGIKELVSGDVYERDAKYGEARQSKARGRLARLFPSVIRERFARD